MDSAAASICTICLELVIENNGRSTARLQCNHVFHLGMWVLVLYLAQIRREWVRSLMSGGSCSAPTAVKQKRVSGYLLAESLGEAFKTRESKLWKLEMSMMLIHNASASYHHVPVPTFHQLHQNRWNAQVPHTLVGNGAVNRATQSLFASQPGRVLMRVHDAGLGVVPPLLTHEYQVLREVPSLPYESTATPTVHQMRVSSNQSQQPPLARVPVYVPNRPSNYRRVMNHVTQTQPPSSLVGSYVITPFSGFMSGLQFPPHTFGGPS
ncbi:hypothetical protein LguiA_031203 [Lonicera macranthoides]